MTLTVGAANCAKVSQILLSVGDIPGHAGDVPPAPALPKIMTTFSSAC